MYTDKDIVDYFKNVIGVTKTRKRKYLDQRNYLIAVLYEKFKYTDLEIAAIFKIDRSTVNVSRRIPYFLMVVAENEEFHEHVKDVIDKFPCMLRGGSVPKTRKSSRNIVTVRGLNHNVYKEYQKRAKALNVKISTYIKWYLEESVDINMPKPKKSELDT